MNVGITFFVQGTAKLQKSGQQEMVSRFCALPRPEVQHHLQHPPDSGYSSNVRHPHRTGQRQGFRTPEDGLGSSGNGKTFPGSGSKSNFNGPSLSTKYNCLHFMARKNCILLSYIGSQVCNCEISVTLNGPSLKTNAANIKITTILCAKGLKSTLEKMD